MKNLFITTFALIFVSHLCYGSTPIEITPWPMFQGNAGHTGYISTTINPKDFKFDWRTYVGDVADSGLNYGISQAMTDAGYVYVSRHNYVYSNTLQAFALIGGVSLWKKSYGSSEVTPPTIVGNKLFIQVTYYASGGENAGLYAYSPFTGDGVVLMPAISTWYSFISSTYYDGSLYFNSQGEGLNSFNTLTNTVNWDAGSRGEYVIWTPAVNDRFVVTYVDGDIQIHDRQSGVLLRSFIDSHYDINGSADIRDAAPVLTDTNKIIIIENGYLTIYDAISKEIAVADGSGFNGQPVVDKGFIYANQGGALVAYQYDSGLKLMWKWSPSTNERIGNQFLCTDNLIILATESHVYAIDKITHQTTWSYAISSDAQLSLGMGHLFVMQQSGDLLAFQVKSL